MLCTPSFFKYFCQYFALSTADKVLSPEQVREYETCRFAREAIKLIGSANDEEVITPLQHARVRNYAIVNLVLWNATRSGPIKNFSNHDLENATQIRSGDGNSYVYNVSFMSCIYMIFRSLKNIKSGPSLLN